MYIIVSCDITQSALRQLEKHGETLLFRGVPTVYESIRNHPDIFMCYTGQQLITAPDCIRVFANEHPHVPFELAPGHSEPGCKYPQTTPYNAVCTFTHLIHNTLFTDAAIRSACISKTTIHVSQGYTRCNLLPLCDNAFITSDRGIESTLLKSGMDVMYVNPTGIRLKGFKHGFFGGCCGIVGNTLLINGSLNTFSEKNAIEAFCSLYGLRVLELSNAPAEDIGSLVCLGK